ncbi:unnamed protein product [Darwinula stevensoni]|uniref:Uncharacterized protein n=1 Tax=Darwinula stevensoni TaxID=69355 RepID=A0A7R8XB91_9CRUS|nr:unnamed protein product [Darwinula stevensoni]CAG0892628.1 unnamed protein product [Darwinula stevensoni]
MVPVREGWMFGSWFYVLVKFNSLFLDIEYPFLLSRWNLNDSDASDRHSVPADLLPYLELGEMTLKELRRLLNLPGWTLVDTAPHNTSIKRINVSEYSHTLFLVQVHEVCKLQGVVDVVLIHTAVREIPGCH